MGFEDERTVGILSVIVSVFIFLTLEKSVGVVYAIMGMLYMVIAYSRPNKIIQFKSRNIDLALLLFTGTIVVAIWFLITVAAFSVLGYSDSAPFSIMSSGFSSVLRIDNPLVMMLVWGVFIPIVETVFFFGVLMKFLADKMSVKWKFDIPALMLIIMMGAAAVMFHLGSQAIIGDSALVSDFIFFSVSAAIVLKYKELQQAAYAHIILNTLVMANYLGMIMI